MKRSRNNFEAANGSNHDVPRFSKASKIDPNTNDDFDDVNVDKHLKAKIWKYFEEGYTIPFLARYRKEAIGGLSADALRHLHDEHEVKK